MLKRKIYEVLKNWRKNNKNECLPKNSKNKKEKMEETAEESKKSRIG